MRTNSVMLRLWMALALSLIGSQLANSDEPGKEVMGSVLTELIFATNGSLEDSGTRGKELSEKEIESLHSSGRLNFKSYRRLGSDEQPVWRAFENWSVPMKPSEEVMVSFEPKGEIGKDALRLDLKLWLQKREVLSALPVLKKGMRLYILGPKWRGGNLIIGIELVDLQEQ